eukprot:4847540-Prymnesium_polylepis.1
MLPWDLREIELREVQRVDNLVLHVVLEHRLAVLAGLDVEVALRVLRAPLGEGGLPLLRLVRLERRLHLQQLGMVGGGGGGVVRKCATGGGARPRDRLARHAAVAEDDALVARVLLARLQQHAQLRPGRRDRRRVVAEGLVTDAATDAR